MPIPPSPDVEEGLGKPVVTNDDEEGYDGADENQALLANTNRNEKHSSPSPKFHSVSEDDGTRVGSAGKSAEGYQVGPKKMSGSSYWARLVGAFAVGVLCTVVMQLIIGKTSTAPSTGRSGYVDDAYVDEDFDELQLPPHVSASEVHHFPPAEPTNKFPEYFPSNVGYAGPTPTGAEAALMVTAPAWPVHTGAPHLVVPTKLHHSHKEDSEDEDEDEDEDDSDSDSDDDEDEDEEEDKRHHHHHRKSRRKRKFSLFEKWGNLSPWYSVDRGAFGLDSGVEPPETCRVTGLHFLHRHGARYPTADSWYAGPARLARRLRNETHGWTGSGRLQFLNDWSYKLGAELLTPFGRQQLYDLGVTMRIKYGFLLDNFTDTNTLPVFRTESQDRMLSSAMNFALGFFGWPAEDQYQQLITIESKGFNNTLAPEKTCPNGGKSQRAVWYMAKWADIYLQNARKRLARDIKGFDLTIEDVYSMQEMCAYETVAIGYSKFCELFTMEEWEGFNYAMDLFFWYGFSFGSPVARTLGVGWVQELVARLTHTPISVHNSSTNATLDDNSVTFPLDHPLYVDATHEVVVLEIITALNLTSFAEQGPLPYTHIPKNRSFRVAEVAPFATNLQLQLLECSAVSGPQIRIIINDGVVPLTGIKGCPEQADGMCPVDTFVEAMREVIRDTDWKWGCEGDWEVPEGDEWNTTTGEPPRKI